MAETKDKKALVASPIVDPTGGTLLSGALGGAFGAGKTSPNIGNQQVQMSNLYDQANLLREYVLEGRMDQADYEKQVSPILDQAHDLLRQVSTMGQKPANNIHETFYRTFVNGGFMKNTGGDAWAHVTQADQLGSVPYKNSKQIQDIITSYKGAGKPSANAIDDIKAYGTTFQQMFSSAIGRDPTDAEYEQFFSNVVQNDRPWEKPLDQTQLRQETTGLLNQFYSGEAQKVAEGKARAESEAAIAPGSAFDTWSQGYRKSLTDVESSLQDYQSRLFEKLRPQLLTSLKAQGLLDTGALNASFAGAAEDLGAESQRYLANARTGIEADIANQKYGLQSAPSQFKLSNIYNTVPQITQSGQTALQNVYGNMVNQNMFNQQAALQRELANQQYGSQPSLLSQYGGMILGGVAGGFGQGVGNRMSKWGG